MRIHDLRRTFGTLGVQVMPLTDVKAYMGHRDIQTTMIYVHHVPRHDVADKLTESLKGSNEDPTRRTLDARISPLGKGSASKSSHRAKKSAGSRTRTCDTRITIAGSEFGLVRAGPGNSRKRAEKG